MPDTLGEHIELDCGPRRTFQLKLSSLRTKPALGNTLFFSSVSCSCDAAPGTALRKWALPVASPPLSEQRKTWSIFAKQIEIFQVKAWLATFKARKENLNLLDDDKEKRKKTQSTCRGRSRPPPSIDRRSPQPRLLQVSFQICRVLFL